MKCGIQDKHVFKLFMLLFISTMLLLCLITLHHRTPHAKFDKQTSFQVNLGQMTTQELLNHFRAKEIAKISLKQSENNDDEKKEKANKEDSNDKTSRKQSENNDGEKKEKANKEDSNDSKHSEDKKQNLEKTIAEEESDIETQILISDMKLAIEEDELHQPTCQKGAKVKRKLIVNVGTSGLGNRMVLKSFDIYFHLSLSLYIYIYIPPYLPTSLLYPF